MSLCLCNPNTIEGQNENVEHVKECPPGRNLSWFVPPLPIYYLLRRQEFGCVLLLRLAKLSYALWVAPAIAEGCYQLILRMTCGFAESRNSMNDFRNEFLEVKRKTRKKDRKKKKKERMK